MGQFSPYGPSPIEVMYGTPEQAERFLGDALRVGAPERAPAVYVRNWLRSLETRPNGFAACRTLCELWLEEHDGARESARQPNLQTRA